jgi:hypothetical protein
MSFLTTQPEMLASVASTLNVRFIAGGSPSYPRDCAGMDGNPRSERRRNGRSGNSPMEIRLNHRGF